ncbi:MAG: hypothetical protein IJA62_00945 [Ruminococcus sp.]|nr:hypothetical protein [Ruminococcus sp.]
MKEYKHTKAKEASLKSEDKNELGAKLSAPVILASVILLSLAYITDIIYTKNTVSAVGETFIISRFLLEAGNLLQKLIFPLISTGIAAVYGGLGAIPGGLLGGMLAGIGSTYESANANATSVSGVFCSLLAGFIAGSCTRSALKIFRRHSQKDEVTPFIFVPAFSLIITLFAVLLLNTVSGYINYLACTLAGLAGKTNPLAVSVILGIFMTADAGGPLYLAGYTFGVASISTGNPEYMAIVIAAGAIPPLTMGLYTIAYKERTQGYEKALGIAGIGGGLLGLPQSALVFYTKKTYRFILACIPGGILAGMLSLSLNCSSELPAGGILSFTSYGRPLFFIFALACGAMVSTFLLSLTDGYNYITETQNHKEGPEAAESLSVQI